MGDIDPEVVKIVCSTIMVVVMMVVVGRAIR